MGQPAVSCWQETVSYEIGLVGILFLRLLCLRGSIIFVTSRLFLLPAYYLRSRRENNQLGVSPISTQLYRTIHHYIINCMQKLKA